MHTIIYQLLIVSLVYTFIEGEYFTSSGHLRYLFGLEKQLASKLKDLIKKEEIRLARLKNFHEKIKHLENVKDANKYIRHPTNVYQLISRLHGEWPRQMQHTEISKGDFVEYFQQYEEMLPSQDDLTGARSALLRLQETFGLSAKQIGSGIVANPQQYTKLSMKLFSKNPREGSSDMFEIGRMAYLEGRHDITVGWMSESLRLFDIQNDNAQFSKKVEILDHLAWSEFQMDMIPSAYNHTKQLLMLQPDNERVARNKALFEEMLTQGYEEDAELPNHQLAPHEFPRFYYTSDEDGDDRYFTEKKLWQKLCRGETKPIPKKYTKYMVCWQKSNHPLLVLKPARLERLYPNPELIFFRQAVSDHEIEQIKTLAIDMLQRATVHNPATGKLEFADYRTSKSAWLDESHGKIVDIMDKRIEAYTGLSMETAEKLQVANYGMAGHYETHFDFGRSVPLRPPPNKNRTDYTYRFHKENKDRLDGHRVATWLTYMSDVEAGGATVFTNIGQAVYPSKGDAVFWYNLHHDGTGDVDTRHAACPVLIGEKWVSNRWIHERGQEFRKPCHLKIDDDYLRT